jgi:hypothetical protein
MGRLSFLVLLTGVGLMALAPQTPDKRQQALRVFRNLYADVRWQLETPIAVELTGDGETDLAIQGSYGPDLAVAVIVGPIGPLSQMLKMMWRVADDPASSDCLRSPAPKLATEPVALPIDLWGCVNHEAPAEFCSGVRETDAWLREAGAQGMLGLRVTGAGCDEVHFHWNPRSKRFDYWIAR